MRGSSADVPTRKAKGSGGALAGMIGLTQYPPRLHNAAE